MEFEEIINPLDKLKIRPAPKKFTPSAFFLLDQKKEDDDETEKMCTFTDNRENVKVNRKEILKNIITHRNSSVVSSNKHDTKVPHKKIIIKPIEEDKDDGEEEEEQEQEKDNLRESKKEGEKEEKDDDEKHEGLDSEKEKEKELEMEQEEEQKEKDNLRESKKPKKQGQKEKKEKKEKEEIKIEDDKIEDDKDEDDKIEDDEDEIEEETEIEIKGLVVFTGKDETLNLVNPLESLKSQKSFLNLKTSTYYLNNRKLFIEKLEKLFTDYKIKAQNNPTIDNELLLHQKIAREYLNIYSPYRGLLLYYGLGTGKSATAVAIAEGLKSDKRVFLMIPASLETSFINEIKKFGDPIYREKQHWIFVSIEGQPQNVKILSKILSLTEHYIKQNKGAWFMNIEKEPNYDSLNERQKTEVNEQLIEMIKSKYHQINYNANNLKSNINNLSRNHTINPFDNSVIIIDEAHKLISTIVNKLNKGGKLMLEKSVSIQIYQLLMTASNCRIVLLTGTPIVNYPNEIAVLFNILRGCIKTWSIDIPSGKKIDRDSLLEMFYKSNFHTYDYVNISNRTIQITRNPFGFVNQYEEEREKKTETKKIQIKAHNTTKRNGGSNEFERYKGVVYDESGNISDVEFEKSLLSILKKIDIQSPPQVQCHKALPDTLDAFNEMFLNIESFENPKFKEKQAEIFMKRILGLSSFYRVSETDPSLPELIDGTDPNELYHIQYCPMSDYQFGLYREIRKKEVEQQKKAMKIKRKKGDEVYDVSSTYRVYSRACCNFAFPNPPGRPYPKVEETTEEDEIDGETANAEELIAEGETVVKVETTYKERITEALDYLKKNETKLLKQDLEMYSPKFSKILENIKNPEHIGLHLVYSQFRTLEGIGIFQSVLEANGFVQFKLTKKSGSEWQIQTMEQGKPTFVLYTGTEEQEERELIRNIYNGDWQNIPSSLRNDLVKISSNNLYGEIIKVMMITSSAAEGINLRNTRFVHLMEPYWHIVRLEQVIGRARRYQSHLGLPEKYRNVKVFLYLSSFSETQIDKINNTIGEGELKLTDISKRKPFPLFTTDQTLFEMSQIKKKISDEILTAVKSASVDCKLHHLTKDSYSCYTFGNVSSNAFSYKPTLEEDILERAEEKKVVAKGVKLTIKDKVYYAYQDEKNDNNKTEFTLYSDERLKTTVGVFDKVAKKLKLM